MIVRRAFKTELALNHEQVTACRRHAGAARYAYNWGWSASKRHIALPAKAQPPLTCIET